MIARRRSRAILTDGPPVYCSAMVARPHKIRVIPIIPNKFRFNRFSHFISSLFLIFYIYYNINFKKSQK
jgi:hypothetical protein